MVSHTVYFKGMMVVTLTSPMYHRISVLVPVLVRVPEYLSTSTSTSTSTMTLELTSTSTVRVQEIQYSSIASTSTEYEYPSPGHGWGHSLKSQCGSNILSTHIPFVPCQSALPFLRYSIFKIWTWKSRVKVMGEVTVQSHNVGLASYRLTSLLFHVNRPSHSWDTAFSKFDLENQGSRSWVRSDLKFTMWV